MAMPIRLKRLNPRERLITYLNELFVLVEQRQFFDRNTTLIGMSVGVKRQELIVNDDALRVWLNWSLAQKPELSRKNQSSFVIDMKSLLVFQGEYFPITVSIELLKQSLQNSDSFLICWPKICNRLED